MQDTEQLDRFVPRGEIPCTEAITSGRCHADCCRVTVAPFLRKVYDALHAKRFCEADELLIFGDVLFPYRADHICVFLDQISDLCNIYALRPQMCSAFGLNNNCFHYNGSGKLLTRAERRSGNWDTHEGVDSDFSSLRKTLRMNAARGLTVADAIRENPEQYAEFFSLAAPTLALKGLQLIAPWKVIDRDTLEFF